MNSQWITNPAPNASSARMASATSSSMWGQRPNASRGYGGSGGDRREHEDEVARRRMREAAEAVDARLGRAVDHTDLARRDRLRQRHLRAERRRQRTLELIDYVLALQIHDELRRRAHRRRDERDHVLHAADVLERVERELEDLAPHEPATFLRRLPRCDRAPCSESAERIHDGIRRRDAVELVALPVQSADRDVMH